MVATVEAQKRQAAMAAALLVEDQMRVGLGTGTTVAYLLPALAARGLSLRCVATSPRTERAAVAAGLVVEPFEFTQLDVAIDGADQISAGGWLVKGGGGAHTREKMIAAAARQFVVIADSTKLVERLHPPIPLELSRFGLRSTLQRLGTAVPRDAPTSPDGGIIADFTGPIADPAELAAVLAATPGVVEHGLFPPQMVSLVLVGRGDSVQRLEGAKR